MSDRDVEPWPDFSRPARLAGSSRVLHEMTANRAEEDPHRTVAEFVGGETHTARQMVTRFLSLAAGLQGLGLQPDDRVVIMLDNCVEFLDAFLGVSACGAVSVPVNTAMRGVSLRHQVRETQPVLVVADSAYASEICDALISAECDATVVLVGEGSAGQGTLAFADLINNGQGFTRVPRRPQDLAAIFYTSGTTGPSKGVMWSHNFCVNFAEVGRAVMQYEPRDVIFTSLPMFHGNALFLSVLPAVLFDGKAVVARRFSLSSFWAQITACRATKVSLLGVMGPLLLRQAPTEAETGHDLQLALMVPAPTDPAEFERRFQAKVASLYGLSDAGVVIATPPAEHRPSSAGKPLPGWTCEIFDEDDQPVPDGVVGELVLRPRWPGILPIGYWRSPQATLDCYSNLWLHTGDLLRRDADGWFYFVDRKKDALRRSGENVSTYEVEEVLLTHPDVQEAAVFGVRAELAEEEVMATLVLRDGASASPQEIIEFCEPHLPYFAVPRFVNTVRSLPKTETQKVQKNLLRELGVAPSTWDRGTSRRGR